MNVLMVGGLPKSYNLEWYVKNALEKTRCFVNTFYQYEYAGIIGRQHIRVVYKYLTHARRIFQGFGINKVNEKLREETVRINPDLMLSMGGELILPKTVEWIRDKLGIPTVLWFPDDFYFFHGVSKHIASAYDYVFTGSEYCVPMYRDLGLKKVQYLPFACDPSVHKCVNLTLEEKNIYGGDICFVGSYFFNRVSTLKVIADYDLHIWGSGWNYPWIKPKIRRRYKGKPIYGLEMVKVYNATNIVLNIHHSSDLYDGTKANMKVFEATGCGSFLLTDRPVGLEEFYRIGEELVCYKDNSELVELIDYYLANPEERMMIARRGQERAYKDHTYAIRVKKLLNTAKAL